jgi:CSLREA domain-containing protein
VALADATTFTVNTTDDSDDGACSPLVTGNCTLREAISAANNNAGKDTIAFAIPGEGVRTIKPKTQLPNLAEPVIVDGYTQPGAQENTAANGTNAVLRIELDGSEIPAATSPSGFLDISEQGSTFRGLVINNFYFGIIVRMNSDSPLTVIEGNFIGTNPAGETGKANTFGIYAYVATEPGSGNLRIGGADPAARNLISGNIVGIGLDSLGNTVQGNLIGTDRSGAQALGNGDGILLDNGGGLIADNVIAFNTDVGIYVYASAGTGHRFDRNAIFGNGELGIDLNTDGPTPNDPGDSDTGPNNLQNFPVLTAATISAGETTITGALDSLPNRQFLLQFFANPNAADAEGRTFLGEQQVSTDGNGVASFTFTAGQRRTGQAITSTATNITPGEPTDTSELSPPVTVQEAAPAAGPGSGSPDDPGKTLNTKKKDKKGKKGKKGKKSKKGKSRQHEGGRAAERRHAGPHHGQPGRARR